MSRLCRRRVKRNSERVIPERICLCTAYGCRDDTALDRVTKEIIPGCYQYPTTFKKHQRADASWVSSTESSSEEGGSDFGQSDADLDCASLTPSSIDARGVSGDFREHDRLAEKLGELSIGRGTSEVSPSLASIKQLADEMHMRRSVFTSPTQLVFDGSTAPLTALTARSRLRSVPTNHSFIVYYDWLVAALAEANAACGVPFVKAVARNLESGLHVDLAKLHNICMDLYCTGDEVVQTKKEAAPVRIDTG